MSRPVHVGLLVLAAPQLVVGAWALTDPVGFFDGFPAAGHAWVRLLPPYNEHLVRDVGALHLALTVVLVVAAVTLQEGLVRAALVAELACTVPHAAFHVAHLHGLPLADAVAQTAGFAVQVVLPLLLIAGRRPGPRPRPRAARPPSPSPSARSA